MLEGTSFSMDARLVGSKGQCGCGEDGNIYGYPLCAAMVTKLACGFFIYFPVLLSEFSQNWNISIMFSEDR
jgi:hypothetical protein